MRKELLGAASFPHLPLNPGNSPPASRQARRQVRTWEEQGCGGAGKKSPVSHLDYPNSSNARWEKRPP